jgi:hypothetical protein
MLLWIVIYSFFESFDFIDEVQRLCGGVTFWAAVTLSVAIALRGLLSRLAFFTPHSFHSSACSCEVRLDFIRPPGCRHHSLFVG